MTKRLMIPLALVTITFVGSSQAQLFTHFPMEETESPLIDIASGSTADAVDSGHIYQEDGPAGFGHAVGLTENGSWQFDLAESQVYNIIGNDFSVAAWVYLDSFIQDTKSGANSALNRVFGDDVGWDADGWAIGVWNDGRIRFTKNGITDSDTGASWVVANEWTHIAATVSSTEGVTIYHNGDVAESWPGRTPNVNPWPGNNGEEDIWGVGRTYGNGEAQWFGGLIDELRVYANVLDEEDIEGLMIPPTIGLVCDFNGDDICEVMDIDMLFASGDIAAGVAANGSEMDLNGDGTINLGDVDEWLSIAAAENGFGMPYLKGDSNLDGNVDATDLNTIGVNWLSTGRVWSTGDYTGESDVNALDLNTIGVNWQKSNNPQAAAVPEPSGVVTLIFGVFGLALRRFRS